MVMDLGQPKKLNFDMSILLPIGLRLFEFLSNEQGLDMSKPAQKLTQTAKSIHSFSFSNSLCIHSLSSKEDNEKNSRGRACFCQISCARSPQILS